MIRIERKKVAEMVGKWWGGEEKCKKGVVQTGVENNSEEEIAIVYKGIKSAKFIFFFKQKTAYEIGQ